jgi:hypothetical protein
VDEDGLKMLHSSVKKVSTFMKKLKNLSSPFAPAQLLTELKKLDVSNYLTKSPHQSTTRN